MLRQALALPLVLAISIPEASAEVNRCATGEADVAFNGNDFVNFSGDTGWFPGSSPAQLRLTARVAGSTLVGAGYTATGCWGDEMQTKLAPRAGTGYLDVAYGAELALFGRIHATVLGQDFDWEGRINIPYIPDDLLISGATDFNPKFGTTASAAVEDSTAPVRVIQTNLLADIISLGAISGGLYVTVKASMTASYRNTQTSILTTMVDAATDLVTIGRPDTGFHSNLAVPMKVDGVVRYAPKLTFAAGFNVRLLGIQVVNWELVSIPVTLPGLDRTVQLTGDPALLPLPELDGIGKGARMDFSEYPTQTIRVTNTGDGPLQIEATNVPAGITVAPVTLAAGAIGELSVTAADGAVGGGGTLTFATNDPDRPTLAIALAQSGGTDAGDDDDEKADELGMADGGCATGSGQGAGLLVLCLGLLLFRRRRS